MRIHFSAFLALLIVVGCSGGGEGNLPLGQSGSGYTGVRTDAQIDGYNGKLITLNSMEAIDIAEFLSLFSGELQFQTYFFTDTGVTQSSAASVDTCSSGSQAVNDDRNSQGIGSITYIFTDCAIAETSVDGRVTVFVDSDRQNTIDVSIETTNFRLSQTHPSGSELVVSGTVELPRNIDGRVRSSSTIWQADLLVDYPRLGTQTEIRNLVKTQDDVQYTLRGDILHSSYGRVELSAVAADQEITLTGAQSSLDIDYQLTAGFVSDYTISLTSGNLNTLNQAISLSVFDLVSFRSPGVGALGVEIQGETAFEQGVVGKLRAMLPNIDSEFYAYDWEVDSFSGDCQLEDVQPRAEVFSFSAGCFGNLTISLTAGNTRQSSTTTFDVRVLKELADIAYEASNDIYSTLDSFTLIPVVNNLEQGPYSFEVLYGLSGTSINAHGQFFWSMEAAPPLLARVTDLHYGIGATNDRTAVTDLVIRFERDDYMPPNIFLNPDNNIGSNHGAIDLDPIDPTTDIAFIRRGISGSTQVLKYNKLSGDLRTVANVPDNFPRSLEVNSRAVNFLDYDGDGVEELAYVYISPQDTNGDLFIDLNEIHLLIYDFAEETVLLDDVVLSFTPTSTSGSEDLFDIQMLDTDGDNVEEIVFYQARQIRWVANGVEYRHTAFSYDPVEQITTPLFSTDREQGEFLRETRAFRMHALPANGERGSRLIFATRWGGAADLAEYEFDGSQFSLNKIVSLNPEFGLSSVGAFASFFVKDLDGDGEAEISIIFDDGNNSCFREEQQNNGYIAILNNNAELLVEHQTNMNFYSAGDSVSDDPNIFLSHFECLDGNEENFKISYFSPLHASPIWTTNFVDPPVGIYDQMLPVRDAVTSFLDIAGRRRIISGDLISIRVSQ